MIDLKWNGVCENGGLIPEMSTEFLFIFQHCFFINLIFRLIN